MDGSKLSPQHRNLGHVLAIFTESSTCLTKASHNPARKEARFIVPLSC